MNRALLRLRVISFFKPDKKIFIRTTLVYIILANNATRFYGKTRICPANRKSGLLISFFSQISWIISSFP